MSERIVLHDDHRRDLSSKKLDHPSSLSLTTLENFATFVVSCSRGLEHVMSRHVTRSRTSCHVTSRGLEHIMSRHVTRSRTCHVTSRHEVLNMSRHVTSRGLQHVTRTCHVTSRHVASTSPQFALHEHVSPYHITSRHGTSTSTHSHCTNMCVCHVASRTV